MTKLKFSSEVYEKEVILYTLNQYDIDYNIQFKDNNFEIIFNDKISLEDKKVLKKKINSNQLRKDIANSNKKIREYIIATALGFPEK